jgi:hypothetical protein
MDLLTINQMYIQGQHFKSKEIEKLTYAAINGYICVCVCVWDRERERKRVSVCLCVCVYMLNMI